MSSIRGARLFKVLSVAALGLAAAAQSQAQSLALDKFGHTLPENIQWASFSAFPQDVKLSIVVGDPRKPGPFVVRVRVAADAKIAPHKHPEDRIYTVMAGVFYIGLGETFDPDKLRAYPPGTVLVLPGGTPHFHWAKSGEYTTQVSAIGPLGLEYINKSDDPRNK